MALPVVTVGAGGIAVVDVSATTPKVGLPVSEAANGRGIAITKVTAPAFGLAVTYTTVTMQLDVTPPAITSASLVSNPENTVLAHALTASEAVTWSIVAGVADAERFELLGSTLRWLGNGVKDWENPDDFDQNNSYVVDIKATDTVGFVDVLRTTVFVTNVADPT